MQLFNGQLKRFNWQFIKLFSVNIIAIPVGILTSIIVTDYLGPQGFGDYKLITSVFNIGVIFFTFGFFQAGNRAMVLAKDRQTAKELYGAEFFIMVIISVITTFSLMIFARYDDNLYQKNLSNFLLYLSPFAWVFLMARYFESLFQADNQIKSLISIRLYPKIGFLILVGLVFMFPNIEINKLGVIWCLYLFSHGVIFISVALALRISFQNLKIRLKELWHYNKKFGLNMYTGTLFSLGLASLTEILISYFGIDNSGVGFYSLALTVTMPLMFIPNTIATTHYKKFSQSNGIQKKLIVLTLGLSIVALIILDFLIGPIIEMFYGPEFKEVIDLSIIVSIGVLFHGLGDFFNSFLAANGEGKTLRNVLIMVGCCILICNIIFIPKFGVYGAAVSKVISSVFYLIMILIYYKRFVQIRKEERLSKNEA